jgi:hypothetical protein
VTILITRRAGRISVPVPTAAAAAIPTATAEISLHHGFRFVDSQSAAVKLRPIQLPDRLVRVFFGHRDKAKAFRAACITIGDNAHSLYGAKGSEGVSNIVFGGLEGKVSNKQFF